MIYGYARVSTKGQARDGNSLEYQEKLLKDAGAEKIFADSFTGTKTSRPEFDSLINALVSGDTLVVCKLDRFARSLSQGSELITRLIDKGVTVNILNLGVMDNSGTGKLIRNIFLSFAEFERDMIIQRTAEGKAIAKQKDGFREGRPPKFGKQQIELALKLLDSHSLNQVAEMTGISRSTLARAKRKNRL